MAMQHGMHQQQAQQGLAMQHALHEQQAQKALTHQQAQHLQQMQQALGTQQIQHKQDIARILSSFNAESMKFSEQILKLNTMLRSVRAKEQITQDADTKAQMKRHSEAIEDSTQKVKQ